MSKEGAVEQREGATAAAPPRGWRLAYLERLRNPPRSFAIAVYAIAVIGVLFALYMLALGLIAFVKLGHQIAFNPSTVPGQSAGTSSPRSDIAGSLTVFFTVLGALIAGPLLIWRVITAHIQAQAAQHQAETGREAHYTTLFTKAVEQLGATREIKEVSEIISKEGVKQREVLTRTEPNLEVRLGAIYALERIASESERDHWPIMEVLCAYARDYQNSGRPKNLPKDAVLGTKEFQSWIETLTPPRADIDAILNVIGRRSSHWVEYEKERDLWLDLSGGNFQRAKLNGAELSRINFCRAHLESAHFFGGNMQNAMCGGTHFEDAGFHGTNLEDSWLDDAHLVGAYVKETNLRDARLRRANLRHAILVDSELDGAQLTQVQLKSASFENVSVRRAQLSMVDFSEARTLQLTNLDSAIGDTTTILPKEVLRPSSWPND
jgi:uncharacterized protein YjbI with pentapeptide repeats